MRLKAIDTFHTSQTKTVRGGAEFEVHDALGDHLISIGLATRVGQTTPIETSATGDTPVEAQPGVKAEPPLENKAQPIAETKRSRRRKTVQVEKPAEEEA